MINKVLPLAFLMIFSILFGCGKDEVSETQSPGRNELLTAPNDNSLVEKFLHFDQKRYKEYDSKNNCLLRASDEVIYCSKLEVIYAQEEKQGRTLYVAESSILRDDDGNLQKTHTLQGVITLFVIQQTGDELKITSQSEEISNGSYGVPNPVKTYRQGNGTARGWILTDGDAHQGYSGGTISLFLQKSRDIAPVATINVRYDDTEHCASDDSDCSVTSLSTDVETIYSPNSKYFDLKIETNGSKIEKGKKEILINNKFTVKFDESKFAYKTDAADKLYEGLEY